MRNIFYALAALIAFGTAYYYYLDVAAQTATINKLRLTSSDGMVIEAGTVIDEDFMEDFVVAQKLPAALAADFRWALDDNEINRISLRDQVFSRDVEAGSFLERGHFFVTPEDAFARRIREGHRAFSIPVSAERAVENFIAPEARVDVIGTFETESGAMVSRRLLENVEVMAVGTYDSRGEYEIEDRPGYGSVTLQAPVEKVEHFLAEAEAAQGDLTLVLRNPCEDAAECVGGAPAEARHGSKVTQ